MSSTVVSCVSASYSANIEANDYILHEIQTRARKLQIRGWVVKIDPDSITGVLVGRRENVANMKNSLIRYVEAHGRWTSSEHVPSVDFQANRDMSNPSVLPPKYLVLTRDVLRRSAN